MTRPSGLLSTRGRCREIRTTSHPKRPRTSTGSSNPLWILRGSDFATISHHSFLGLPIGPDIGAASAARRADEAILEIGQPDVVRPFVGADSCGMAPKVLFF